MRGYPKKIATVQDFENLLKDERFKEQAIADLAKIYQADDATIQRVVSGSEETDDLIVEEIENPLPLWKHIGFKSREAVDELIKKNGGSI